MPGYGRPFIFSLFFFFLEGGLDCCYMSGPTTDTPSCSYKRSRSAFEDGKPSNEATHWAKISTVLSILLPKCSEATELFGDRAPFWT